MPCVSLVQMAPEAVRVVTAGIGMKVTRLESHHWVLGVQLYCYF